MDLFCIGLCKGLFGTIHLTGIFRHLSVITFFWGVNMGSLYFMLSVKKTQDVWQQKKDVKLQQLVLQELIDPIAQHFHRFCRSSDVDFHRWISLVDIGRAAIAGVVEGVSVEVDGSTTP